MSSMNSSARSASRQLAVAQIPDARYVELAGEDVLPYLADAGAIVDEIGSSSLGRAVPPGPAGASPRSCSPASPAPRKRVGGSGTDRAQRAGAEAWAAFLVRSRWPYRAVDVADGLLGG